MKDKKTLVFQSLIAFVITLLLFTPTIASAQYEDSVSDAGGDVFYWHITESSAYWEENVERSNIDIRNVELSETGGMVTLSLTVKGTISESNYVHYYFVLEDENQDDYSINVEGEYCFVSFPNGYFSLNSTGMGTDTLEISMSLSNINTPSSLTISEVTTYDWVDTEEEGDYYYDVAGPDASEPVDGDSDGTSDEEAEEILEKLWAGSMLCIALAIIIPLVIIIIIIVLVVKVLGKDESEGQPPQQPPQQGYQQPPPPGSQQQPPQQEESGTPPPQDSGSEGDEW